MSSFDIFIFKRMFFYQSWSEAGHFITWIAALVRYRGAFPSDDSAFWRTFLAQRELGTKNRHCSAATARRHDNSQSDRKASKSRWVICMERKVHLKNTPKTFFQCLAHYKRTRVNVAKHTECSLPSTTRKQNSHIPFLNVQKVKRWSNRSYFSLWIFAHCEKQPKLSRNNIIYQLRW